MQRTEIMRAAWGLFETIKDAEHDADIVTALFDYTIKTYDQGRRDERDIAEEAAMFAQACKGMDGLKEEGPSEEDVGVWATDEVSEEFPDEPTAYPEEEVLEALEATLQSMLSEAYGKGFGDGFEIGSEYGETENAQDDGDHWTWREGYDLGYADGFSEGFDERNEVY